MDEALLEHFFDRSSYLYEEPGRKTIYLLADNFFRFWYRFVPVNMSAIDSGRITKIYPHAVKQYFADYMGLIIITKNYPVIYKNCTNKIL